MAMFYKEAGKAKGRKKRLPMPDNPTRFESPNTSRHISGNIYQENGEYLSKLNLQIRFKRLVLALRGTHPIGYEFRIFYFCFLMV